MDVYACVCVWKIREERFGKIKNDIIIYTFYAYKGRKILKVNEKSINEEYNFFRF